MPDSNPSAAQKSLDQIAARAEGAAKTAVSDLERQAEASFAGGTAQDAQAAEARVVAQLPRQAWYQLGTLVAHAESVLAHTEALAKGALAEHEAKFLDECRQALEAVRNVGVRMHLVAGRLPPEGSSKL